MQHMPHMHCIVCSRRATFTAGAHAGLVAATRHTLVHASATPAPSNCTTCHVAKTCFAYVQARGASDLDRVRILSEALPYLQQFRGRTIVVKYGGAAMKDGTLKQGVINDLVLLACVGVRPVLVHGGGPEINAWLEKVGIEAQFKNGLRVTGAPPPAGTTLHESGAHAWPLRCNLWQALKVDWRALSSVIDIW